MEHIDLHIELASQIADLKRRYAEYGAEGWTLGEIVKFVLVCVYTLARAVEVIDVLDEEKKRFVMSVVTDMYYSSEVDIPWIMEPFESMLENLVLDHVLTSAVDILITKVKEEF